MSEEPSCEERLKELTQDELLAFVEINRKVKERTNYGVRSELVPKDRSTVLVWSNSAKAWIPAHPDSHYGREAKKAGMEIRLDANMIVVPYDYKFVKKAADCLQALPLYSCSFEAKMRGEVDPIEATFCWALKQLQRGKEEEIAERYR